MVETPAPPLSSRRKSCVESTDGGGATTAGAGRVAFAVRKLSRSGADTGGGTTAGLVACTREVATSCPTDVGAGGTTFGLSVAAERERSREICDDAGPITFVASEGAAREPFRETLGAGAMMLGSRAGRYSVWSERTPGAGGTTSGFKAAAARESEATLGAGGTTPFNMSELRAESRATSGAGATTFAGRLGFLDDRRPSRGGGPGLAFTASRFATASVDGGSLTFGASTTCGASLPPRAT